MTQAKITVQKGIPMPSPRSGFNTPKRTYKYPFRTMSVGDSFEVTTTNPNSFRATVRALTKNLDRKFATRSIEEGVLRVWRIK